MGKRVAGSGSGMVLSNRLPLSLLLRRLRHRTVWTIPLDITRRSLKDAHTLVMKLHTADQTRNHSSAHIHFMRETENVINSPTPWHSSCYHNRSSARRLVSLVCSDADEKSTHVPARNAITIAVPRFVRVSRVILPPSARACRSVLLIARC